jgi:hypothetical protein
MEPDGIMYSRFAVNDRPFCVWEWDLEERTSEFLRTLNPKYFEYIAQLHYPELGGENAQLAAVALRTNYTHALESFFALLFASFQAPDCIPGWLAKYQLSDLRALITKVNKNMAFRTKIKLSSSTWESLATAVHGVSANEERNRAVGQELGGFGETCLAIFLTRTSP